MSMREDALGVVVVGTSFGCLTHVRALRAAGFEVVGLVGRDPEKTAERAERFEVPNRLTSLDEALGLPGVDAVTVATPPHTHASIVLDAVAAGKHVVCEKPFARDAAEARQMLKAAEDAGVVHFRAQGGCVGVLQSCASDWGPMLMLGRITGSHGTVWAEGDTVRLADKNGTRTVDVPDDLLIAAPDPPPADLLVTTYDFLHSMGIDYGPYVRLFETFRDLIAGQPVPADPSPATFVDGVANMDVLDAIR